MLKSREEIKDWLLDVWNGNETLHVVFWYYGVLGLLAIIFTANITISVLGPSLSQFIIYPLVILLYLYFLWVTVSVWRSAFNVQWKGWGYMARAFVVISFASSILSLFE